MQKKKDREENKSPTIRRCNKCGVDINALRFLCDVCLFEWRKECLNIYANIALGKDEELPLTVWQIIKIVQEFELYPKNYKDTITILKHMKEIEAFFKRHKIGVRIGKTKQGFGIRRTL